MTTAAVDVATQDVVDPGSPEPAPPPISEDPAHTALRDLEDALTVMGSQMADKQWARHRACELVSNWLRAWFGRVELLPSIQEESTHAQLLHLADLIHDGHDQYQPRHCDHEACRLLAELLVQQ